jgi:RNase P subunit RPR2
LLGFGRMRSAHEQIELFWFEILVWSVRHKYIRMANRSEMFVHLQESCDGRRVICDQCQILLGAWRL